MINRDLIPDSAKMLTLADLPTPADEYNAETVLLSHEKMFEVGECKECGNKSFIAYMKNDMMYVYPCKCRGTIIKHSIGNNS